MAVDVPTLTEVDMPSQLIVLGRGMDGDRPTQATFERAVAARAIWDKYPLELVIFCGARSSLAGPTVNTSSEAGIMYEIAGLPPSITLIEDSSTSTLENFLNSAPLINSEIPTGILAHEAHMRRALFLAKMVLPMTAVPLVAERFGAFDEGSHILERVLLLKEQAALAGIRRGDLESLRLRADRINRLRTQVKPVLRKILGSRSQYN